MKIVFGFLGLIVVALIAFAIYRFFKFKWDGQKLRRRRFEKLRPFFEKLEHGIEIHKSEIFQFAKNPATREGVFQMLEHFGKTDLFPAAYFNMEKAAESNLVRWLEFPTEHGFCPNEIEFLKTVPVEFDKKTFLYYVFKFKDDELHEGEEWSLGVVGPYFEKSKPYDFPAATFSRFGSKFGLISPEEEANWVHENITLKL